MKAKNEERIVVANNANLSVVFVKERGVMEVFDLQSKKLAFHITKASFERVPISDWRMVIAYITDWTTIDEFLEIAAQYYRITLDKDN